MNRPKISVIIGTARASFGSLIASPQTHYMLETFRSLEIQTVKDFEVVIVDSIHKTRDLASEISRLGAWSFKWKVIKNDSWWLDYGLWALQRAFNLGAMTSQGSELLFCGDCFSFPSDSFERSLEIIESGSHPHFLCWKRVGGFLMNPRKAVPEPLSFRTVQEAESGGKYNPGEIYGDSRFADSMMQTNRTITKEYASWQWYYGYGFVSRKSFFNVNGWSELFDGDKALGDVEMGSRLQMAGLLDFRMEKTLVVYEEVHNPISLINPNQGLQQALRSNYDLIWAHRVHRITEANQTKLSDDILWRVVKAEISGLQCWPYSKEIPAEVEKMAIRWIANQSIYKLDDFFKE